MSCSVSMPHPGHVRAPSGSTSLSRGSTLLQKHVMHRRCLYATRSRGLGFQAHVTWLSFSSGRCRQTEQGISCLTASESPSRISLDAPTRRQPNGYRRAGAPRRRGVQGQPVVLPPRTPFGNTYLSTSSQAARMSVSRAREALVAILRVKFIFVGLLVFAQDELRISGAHLGQSSAQAFNSVTP